MLAGILHLRDLNPHIGSMLATGPQRFTSDALSAPRSCAGFSGVASTAVQGVSAFAFQGTNAHAVLQVTCSNHHVTITQLVSRM